ncbi:hypothetical protein MKY09_06670 [Psychrobacillus sp. FSL K6-4046]|uniref:hypothetical protein n=1 Tax=Psychrobacillus sp. FSL K6-4046 TaxID=2921550 RepID=UPI00315AE4B8
MKLSQIISFTISVFFSIVLLILCFLRKLLLTTYTPVTYSMEELKLFIFLAALTTFFFVLTLIFASKIQLIVMTVIYWILFVPNFIAYIKRNINFPDYEMLKFLDETMLVIYLFPCILGIILLVINKSDKKMAIR